jgi:hypothetical protein
MLYAVGSGSEVCVFGESVEEGRKRREKRKDWVRRREEGRGRRVLKRCIAECDVA